MPGKERREHPRISSLNLLSYLCINENQEVVKQGVGRTLNVTENGILMETHMPIDPQYTVSVIIAMKDDLLDMKGKVVHSRPGEDGKLYSGIQFIETDEAALRILKKCIAALKGECE